MVLLPPRGIERRARGDAQKQVEQESADPYFGGKKSLPLAFPPLPSALPMPKSIARRKTKKSAAKRFKITGTGKIMRRKAGLRHLASSKSSKRKRKLGKDGQVDKTMLSRMKELMPFA